MAGRDPNRAQAEAPQLVAELIRAFNARGPLGVLDLGDLISPTYLLDAAERINWLVGFPITVPADWTAGNLTNVQAAGTVAVDTGQLVAGDFHFDLKLSTFRATGVPVVAEWQHRDAANAVTINTWRIISGSRSETFAATFQANERMRAVTVNAMVAGDFLTATVGASLRPV